MHSSVKEAIEQIDAYVFSSDGGGLEDCQEMKRMCERWIRGLDELIEVHSEPEDEAPQMDYLCHECGMPPHNCLCSHADYED